MDSAGGAELKKINGWWCPKCECLMMAKKRRGDSIKCDCLDVHASGITREDIIKYPGAYPEHEKLLKRLKRRQQEWKHLYVKEPSDG